MRQLRLPLLSGLMGGAVVAVLMVALGVGGDGKTTTVIRQAPISASNVGTGNDAEGKALTAAEIYKRDAPGVVFIRAQVVQRTQSPFDLYPTERRGESTGTGFVIDRKGDILTNAHVVDNAVKVTVQFSDEKAIDARVVGRDTSSDLAVLELEGDTSNLPPLQLADSNNVRVGDQAIAIGNPLGLDRTPTEGIVSATGRSIKAPNGFAIDDAIQTDAPINPGN